MGIEKNEEFTEARIQQDCLAWFRNNFCLIHHKPRSLAISIPNEGDPRLVQIGAYPGASDTLVFLRQAGKPMWILWIEIKTPTGTQKKNQKKFEAMIKEMGMEGEFMEYHLARSKDDFMKIITDKIVAV